MNTKTYYKVFFLKKVCGSEQTSFRFYFHLIEINSVACITEFLFFDNE